MPAATITTVERRPALASNMLAPLFAVAEAEAAEAEEEAEAAAALVEFFEVFSAAFVVAIVSQALMRVELLIKASNLVWALAAFAVIASAFVALFLVFSANLVALAARVISFWRDFMLEQSSSV